MFNKIKTYFYNRKIERLAAEMLPILLQDNIYTEKEDAVYDSIFFAKQLIKEVWND
jgi:hypothetical protein